MDAKPAPPLTRAAVLLAGLCLAVAVAGAVWPAWDMFGPARRPMLQGWDDSFYYFWLPSVIIDGDVDFSNQLAQAGTLDASARAEALAQPRTATGLIANKYPPGWAVGSLPFFLLAHLIAPGNATGFEPVYLLAVWLGQLLYAALGLCLAARIVGRYFPSTAITAIAVTWLASPLIYYQSARVSMSHNQVFTLGMLVFWTTLRLRDGDHRARQWFLLGLAAALLVITRNVTIVYLAWPGWVLWRTLRSLRAAGWLAAGAFVPLAIQLLAWKSLYGSWLVYSYGGERFDFTHLHLAEVLFSARHGWFYWHPLMLAGTAGFLWWGWRRVEGRAWMISLAAIVVLHAAWPTWWLGSSFGGRGFEVPTLFAAIGLAAIWQKVQAQPALRLAVRSALTLAILWNLVLLTLFLTQRISREQPVSHADSARALQRWIVSPPPETPPR